MVDGGLDGVGDEFGHDQLDRVGQLAEAPLVGDVAGVEPGARRRGRQGRDDQHAMDGPSGSWWCGLACHHRHAVLPQRDGSAGPAPELGSCPDSSRPQPSHPTYGADPAAHEAACLEGFGKLTRCQTSASSWSLRPSRYSCKQSCSARARSVSARDSGARATAGHPAATRPPRKAYQVPGPRRCASRGRRRELSSSVQLSITCVCHAANAFSDPICT